MIDKINKILYEVDIMRLVSACEAPYDEYKGEAENISLRLNPNVTYTTEQLENLIYDVFNASFGYGEDMMGNGHFFGVPRTELYNVAASRIKEELGL